MTPITSLSELRINSGFWYVGTAYSKYREGIEAAYLYARDVGDVLQRAGLKVFVPIISSHEDAVAAGINPRDHDFWMAVDRPWMERAHGLIVIGMDGWDESLGIIAERAYFGAADKPIMFLDPAIIMAEAA